MNPILTVNLNAIRNNYETLLTAVMRKSQAERSITSATDHAYDAIRLSHAHGALPPQGLVNRPHAMCMLKADAYGHGLIRVAEVLADADMFGVARFEEAIALRDAGVKTEILVFEPQRADSARELIRRDVVWVLSSEEDMREAALAASAENRVARCHIALDTGMTRLGFRRPLVDIASISGVSIEGVYTHLCHCADAVFTNLQIRRFSEWTKGFLGIKHIAATESAVMLPTYGCNMVRFGIGLYGYGNTALPLVSAMRVTAPILRISSIESGDCVGYGCSYRASSPRTIATVGIGYGDGLLRTENEGYFVCRNQPCPIVGRVCMDMTMIDVTDAGAIEGETVTVLDDAERFARAVGTISYDMLTCWQPRVKRRFVGVGISNDSIEHGIGQLDANASI